MTAARQLQGGPESLAICRSSARSARDEMRHIVGSSESNVIIGSDKASEQEMQREGQRSHGIACASCMKAQTARGRYFVHEPTSEVNSRMQCVAMIMAMPGTTTTVADLCMFGLAACDEGGPGFVYASCTRTITNARQVGVLLRSKCTGTHRHARVNANHTIDERGTNRNMGASCCASNGGTVEKRTSRSCKTQEQKRKAEGCTEDTRDCPRK